MWSHQLFVWVLAVYQALYGFIAQGIRAIIKHFTVPEPAMELPISSKSTSFIPDCVPADGIRTCVPNRRVIALLHQCFSSHSLGALRSRNLEGPFAEVASLDALWNLSASKRHGRFFFK